MHAEVEKRLDVAEMTIAAQRALSAYMIEKTSKISKTDAKKKVFSYLFLLVSLCITSRGPLQPSKRGCRGQKV